MADKNLTHSLIDNEPAVIAASGTDSAAVDLRGTTLSGVYIPATFTGTSISFLASADGTNFYPVYDGAGNLVSRTVAQGQFIALDPAAFAGINQLKIKSGSTEAAQRTLILALAAYA